MITLNPQTEQQLQEIATQTNQTIQQLIKELHKSYSVLSC